MRTRNRDCSTCFVLVLSLFSKIYMLKRSKTAASECWGEVVFAVATLQRGPLNQNIFAGTIRVVFSLPTLETIWRRRRGKTSDVITLAAYGKQVMTAAWANKWWRRRLKPSDDGSVGKQVMTAACETKWWRRHGRTNNDGGVGYQVLKAAWEPSGGCGVGTLIVSAQEN